MEDKYSMNEAVELCKSYSSQGFACSESVCRALADLYEISLNDDVNKVISVLAAGTIDDGRCGVLEAGLYIASHLYMTGRIKKGVSLEEISIHLHKEFEQFYGGYQCYEIYYPGYEKFQRRQPKQGRFRCAFFDGIILIVNCLNRYM